MSTRGPIICTCGHSAGFHPWRLSDGPDRPCDAVACTCRDFAEAKAARRSKYGNTPTTLPAWPGERFDSKAEAARARDLLLMQSAGHIRELHAHPRYDLIVNGQHVGWFTPDFEYEDVRSGEHVVEDVKGAKTTEASKLRHHIFQAIYGFPVREIRS